MDMNSYQTGAVSTAIYPDSADVLYPAMLIGAEAGEAQNKVQKLIRKGVDLKTLDEETRLSIADEVGDVLWAAAALLFDLNFSMEFIAKRNLEKLADRALRGVINGSGDNR